MSLVASLLVKLICDNIDEHRNCMEELFYIYIYSNCQSISDAFLSRLSMLKIADDVDISSAYLYSTFSTNDNIMDHE